MQDDASGRYLFSRRHALCCGAAAVAGLFTAVQAHAALPGLDNPCRGRLPPELARHELVVAAFDGLDAAALWDVHAHLLGTGDSGSGCTVHESMSQWWRPIEVLRRHAILNAACVPEGAGSVDRAYVERLVSLAADFPAGARWLLFAFDRARRADGTTDPDGTTFHVPDGYARQVAADHAARFGWVASVHPYAPDAMERLAAAQAQGALAIKWRQFALLGQRRFAPFFWVQFLGAGNDNLFKFAFTVLVTYQTGAASGLPPSSWSTLIAALFILPFLLFSATSGQLADKYDKRRLIGFVKSLEIAIMALAFYGFVGPNVPVLLACTFLMGVHSTLFGPVKYAYLPQHLSERELTGGNGMVEMGTFVAILLGNVAGGLLIAIPGEGPRWVALGVSRWRCWAGRSRSSCPPRRRSIRNCASTGIRSPRPGQPEAGAREPRGVPLAAGHLVDVVLRRGLPDPVPGLRQGRAARQRAGGLGCCWWCSRWASAPARCCARC
jgi:hypothetical protein